MHVLLESRGAAASGRGGWTLLSGAVHASLITAAVVATLDRDAPIYTAPPESVSPVYTPAPTPSRRQAPADPTTRTIVIDPTRILIDRPIVPRTPTYDPGIPADLGADPGRDPASIDIGGTPATPIGGIFTERTVERAVLARGNNPRPVFPAQLRSAGVSGSVVVRFVVDTSGAVEPASVLVLEATHPLFADAVRAWIPRTRYLAAQVGGRPVRQLVQQRVEFQLR